MKGLGGLVALKELQLYRTKVGGDVKGLGGLVALTELILENTQVREDVPWLEFVALREHQKTLKGP